MTTRSGWLIGGLTIGVCVMFGTAAAQTAPAGTVDVKTGSAVSATDQASLSEQYVTRMQAASNRVRHLLDEARRQKDVVKTTCLSDKLNQIAVALKSGKDRATSLKAAIARGDTDLRNHEFQVMTVLKQRVDQLDAEANQCVGEELGFPGETKVSFFVDPNIAPAEPGGGGDDGWVYVPPIPASPID